VRVVADRHRLAAYHNKHCWQADYLERHWAPKMGILVIFCDFWLGCMFQQWTAPKSLEIDEDNLHVKFLALNVDFDSLRFAYICSKCSKSNAYEGIKFGYPLSKRVMSAAIDLSNTRTVADRHRLSAYHNKHCWRALEWYQHRWSWNATIAGLTTCRPENKQTELR